MGRPVSYPSGTNAAFLSLMFYHGWRGRENRILPRNAFTISGSRFTAVLSLSGSPSAMM